MTEMVDLPKEGDRTMLTVGQKASLGELARRVRFEQAAPGQVHIIAEEQDFRGDKDYSDERSHVTVSIQELLGVVQELADGPEAEACEACGKAATHHDSEGVPLCDEDFEALTE